ARSLAGGLVCLADSAARRCLPDSRFALRLASRRGASALGNLLALLGDRLNGVGDRLGDLGRSLGGCLGLELGFVCHSFLRICCTAQYRVRRSISRSNLCGAPSPRLTRVAHPKQERPWTRPTIFRPASAAAS